MVFSFNTRASGKYKFYTEDNHGNLVLLSETPNLITNAGLDSIATQTWADAFTHILVGTGTTPASATDTDLDIPLGAPSNSYPSNPASYTLATYDSLSGVTYRLGRSFKIDNPTNNTYSITEVGTSNGNLATPGKVLFSRAILDEPITLFPNRFIYAIYELRLETGVSTTTYELQPETDTAGPSYAFPSNTLGIINNGFAQILINGTVSGKNFATGQALLEPSTTNIYLYKLTTTGTAHFTDARQKFEANPVLATNTTAVAAPTYQRFGFQESVLYDEVLGSPAYEVGTYRRAKHIIVAPTGSVDPIHGFVLTAISGTTTAPFTMPPAGLNTHGIHCAFDSVWNRPADSFVKIYFEHNWHT